MHLQNIFLPYFLLHGAHSSSQAFLSFGKPDIEEEEGFAQARTAY
jgi:hypothetical protein